MFSLRLFFPISFAGVLLLMSSCSSTPEVTEKPRAFEGYGVWMDTVFKTQDKLLRGTEPGMTVQEVKQLEKIEATEEDSTSLYYEIRPDSITEVTLTYAFAEGKLDETEMLIHVRNQEKGNQMLSDLSKYFQSKFGQPVTEKGFAVYSTKTSAGEPVRISVEDRSGVDDGSIYILVYRDK